MKIEKQYSPELEVRCKDKEQELLKKYFGNIIKEAALECPETIGEYTLNLPLNIEAEYKEYLKELWKETTPGDSRTIDDILDEKRLKELITEDEREAANNAYKEACRVTLWEQLTKSNHEDVAHYKGLLKEYTAELLRCMRWDFLEECTREHIKNKTF